MSVLGNQNWKYRKRHGAYRLFDKPIDLWNKFQEYLEWDQENPLIKKEAIKSGDDAGRLIDVPVTRALTMKGFTVFIGCSEGYFRAFEHNNKDNADLDEFKELIEYIKDYFYVQKFEGAAANLLNGNLISRVLVLAEHSVKTIKLAQKFEEEYED